MYTVYCILPLEKRSNSSLKEKCQALLYLKNSNILSLHTVDYV